MMKNLSHILEENAPELLARTKLPRKDADYLTQRQAFDLFRARRLDELSREAPDLYARLSLPYGNPDRLDTGRALALWRTRRAKNQTD